VKLVVQQGKYDEIDPGLSYTLEKTITKEVVQSFADLTGDYNPVHMDDEYCHQMGISQRTVHGLLTTSYISAFIGMHLPGEGSVCLSHHFDYITPLKVGDSIKIIGTVIKKDNDNALGLNIITIKFRIYNQCDLLVVRGISKVSVK
jgi:3-hydroxybutyryl-CoA dehydratase